MRGIFALMLVVALATPVHGGDDPDQQKIEAATNAVRLKLKDPQSARFDSLSIGRAIGSESGEPRENVCGFVNGKNSYGGYEGRMPFSVSIENDGTIGTIYIGTDALWTAIARASCDVVGIKLEG